MRMACPAGKSGGIERGYIKSDYLTRPEVLEYVLARVLEMDHEEFDNPDACQALLDQLQRENNPVRDFWMEMESEFTWDLLPTAFLYDLFISWFRKNHPSGIPVNRNEFATQLVEVLSASVMSTKRSVKVGFTYSPLRPVSGCVRTTGCSYSGTSSPTTSQPTHCPLMSPPSTNVTHREPEREPEFFLIEDVFL